MPALRSRFTARYGSTATAAAKLHTLLDLRGAFLLPLSLRTDRTPAQ